MFAGFSMALLGLAAVTGRVDAQLRTEARGYAGMGDAAADLEFAPRALLTLHGPQLDATAAYAPVLVLHPTRSATPDVLHRGEGHLAWREPDTTFNLGELAAYGTQTFWLVAAPASSSTSLPRMDLLPSSRTLPVISTLTSADVEHRFNDRVRASLGASFQYGGGLDLVAREELPIQRTPRGFAELDWDIGRDHHTLGTRAEGEQTRFVPGPQLRAGKAVERLTLHLEEPTSLMLEGGVGGLDSDAPGSSRTVPAAAIALHHRTPSLGRPVIATVSAQLGPYIDRLSEEGYLRAEGRVAVGVEPMHLLRVGLTAGMGRPVDSPTRGDELYQSAELLAEYSLTHAFAFAGGLRAARQRMPTDREATALWGAFASVTVTEEVLEP